MRSETESGKAPLPVGGVVSTHGAAALAPDKYVHRVVPAEQWPLLGLSELWQMRRILFVLAQRLLKVRYQHTALGIAWVVLQPLVLVLIVSVFMGFVIDRGVRDGLPFAVWLFPAWVAWRIFQKVASEGGSAVGANGALVQRIYLPRIYFPTAVALASLVDLAFMMAAQLVLQTAYGILPGPGLLMLPVAVVIMYLVALGFSYFFSSSSLQYRDMDIVKPLIMQAWFWMSPIIYPVSRLPEEIRTIYYLNPIAVVVEAFRWAFTGTQRPPPEAWIAGALSASLCFVAGYLYFRRHEPLFADFMGE
jgi:lipopolysaccharide transport system permease protein